MLPNADIARVNAWVAARNEALPARAVGLVRYEVDVEPGAVTILECRPPWREDFGPDWTRGPVARMRFVARRSEWTLYWVDRNLKFRRYDDLAPTSSVLPLLAEIDSDPTCIFWG